MTPIRLCFLLFACALCVLGEEAAPGVDWPDFGGPTDDFQADGVVRPWPEEGPERLWQRRLGAGYSAIAAARGELYTMYREGEQDVVVSLDATSGETRWLHRYPAPAREGNLVEFGRGPHATPLVLADRVVTLGYTGWLHALARDTGEVLWRYSLMEDLGGDLLPWGYSASPIEHRGVVLVLVGGPQGVAAFDPADGAVRWKSAPSTVSYSTPRVIDVDGREQLLFFAKDALLALDPADGTELWRHRVVNGYENHASNLLWDGQLLWVATQQEAAGRALRPGRDGAPEVVWRNTKVRMHHWNGVLIEGVVYGSIGDGTQTLAAIDLATGEILWRDRILGLATLVHTPAGTLALEGDGTLHLLALSRDGVEVLARADVMDAKSWSVPTLVGSRLFIRDEESIRAFDLAAAD